jgi:hypothetical protein
MIPGIVASRAPGALAGAIGDPFWDDVVASLHLDGTDGSTVFTDVKGHVFTASGGAQIDTAQSKFGGASLLLDGTDDFITSPDHADWGFGSSDFTIDCWVRFNVDPGTGGATFVSHWEANSPANQRGWIFGLNGNTLRFVYSTDGSGSTTLSAAWNPAAATWYYVSVVRFGPTVYFFVDGQLLGTGNIGTATIFNANSTLQIGTQSNGADFDMNGWIDDVRITRAARYTKTFSRPVRAHYDNLGIPSDERFATAVSILHLDTDFDDERGVTWTPAGNAAIDATQSRFGGASLRLDGTGDWVDATDADFAWGTGDFTIECWTRFSATSGNNFIFTFGGGWGAYRLGSNGTWGVFDGVSANPITSVVSPTTGVWYHVALCRRGTTMRLFINGTLAGSATNSTNFSSQAIRLGAQPAGTGTLNGWIEDFRASNFARYVSDFQPPMRPHPNRVGDPFFDNVISLNHWDGVDGQTVYTDQIAGRTWTNGANGGLLDTAIARFGSASLQFTGASSTNQVNSDGGAEWGFGTDDFTIEFWLYVPSNAGTLMFWDQRGPASAVPTIFQQSGNLLYFVSGVTRITGATPIVAGAWQHIAISRNGPNTRMFHNGTQVGSTWTADTTNYPANRVRLGTNGDTGGGFGTLTGQYDDIRVTRGTGRYQGNFSPPPIAFADAA